MPLDNLIYKIKHYQLEKCADDLDKVCNECNILSGEVFDCIINLEGD